MLSKVLHTNCIMSFPLFELLDALSLPNLRFLEYRNDLPYDVRQFHRVLRASLERSKCPPENLKFSSQAEMADEQRAEYTSLILSLNRNSGRRILYTFC
ncbi:hypothetical protein BDR04DRAFT_102599 [Suillus decipiens]|nr:hypothetical protein BDR04DRAFT_102599 [Suillus decipiens]